MNSKKRVLLLVGSAKRPRSTSESLGTYLNERLQERGCETETLLLHRSLRSEQGRQALLAATDRADVLVFAFPLYADSLPYLVVRAMELIAEHRQHIRGQTREGAKGQRLLAISNSGFPEAHHNDPALAVCRQFAREAGFEWAGGLALGGGQAVNGQPLSEAGGMARNAVESLDIAAAALAEGKPAPQEAINTMARPFIPTWLYTFMGWFGWNWQARQHGTRKKLHDRPYLM